MATFILFALAAATFGSIILIAMCIVFMFANPLGHGVRWMWAITIVVSAGVSFWNWITLFTDVKRCEAVALEVSRTIAKADWLSLGPVCMTSTQLHVALQYVIVMMLISALAWNRRTPPPR